MQTIMKPEYVTFDELKPESQDFTVKVKVFEKSREKESKDKSIIFQPIYLMDEKGKKMKLTLFGTQIKAYEESLEYNGEYEISYLKVKEIEKKYRSVNDDFPLQLSLTRYTTIAKLDPESGTPVPLYLPLAALPKHDTPNQKYDVVGVILYVEPEPRLVDTQYDRQAYVRHIVITDQTQEQTITISAWDDLAGAACDEINKWAEKFLVIGFTALKLHTRTGTKLGTGMSTRIVHDPKGDRPNVLREWVAMNRQLLLDRQSRILQIRLPTAEESLKTIQDLHDKNSRNALAEERHWITATIEEAKLDHLHIYIGCPSCGKKTYAPEGQSFPCLSESCRGQQVVASPRSRFKFHAIDNTGSLELTAFAELCEEMLGKSTEELRIIKYTNNEAEFNSIQQKLQTLPMHFKVGPSLALMRSGALQWHLRAIEHIGDNQATPKLSGMATSDELPSVYLLNEEDTGSSARLCSLQLPISPPQQPTHTPDSKAAAKGKGKMVQTEPHPFMTPQSKSLTIKEPQESPVQKKSLLLADHLESPSKKQALSLSEPKLPILEKQALSLSEPKLHILETNPVPKTPTISVDSFQHDTTPEPDNDKLLPPESGSRTLPEWVGSTNKKNSAPRTTPTTPLQAPEKRTPTPVTRPKTRKKLRFDDSTTLTDEIPPAVQNPIDDTVSADVPTQHQIQEENDSSVIETDKQE